MLLSISALTMAQTKEITVEPGTFSIEEALHEARLARLHGEATDAVITLRQGVYNLCQPIYVRPEDNGTRFVADGEVVISGGVEVKGWRNAGKFWVADAPTFNGRPLLFRQMWVNGQKADRARNVADFEQMPRILSVDKQKETIYVPSSAVRKVAREKRLEMVLHEMWCIANLRIKAVTLMGDSAAVTFHQPESHIHFMHPWPSPMVTADGHNSAFYLTGAASFLDTPGEWFLDETSSKIYYMPRAGETISSAEVVVPAAETLLEVAGTPDRPVTGVSFRGITFSHATWLRPSLAGHAPLQAGLYMTEAFKIRPGIKRPNGDHGLDNQGWCGRPAAAVSINCADDVRFSNCTVAHNASTGIDFGTYVHNCRIDSCEITDCGGNGIMAGSFGGEWHEAHLPYEPGDVRETCRGLVISGNRIHDVTNEDWGTLGICAGYVRDILIQGNEISEVSYSGISMGWGWNQQPCSMANNIIRDNVIHHYAKHMYDVAGIYTLGSQPHSLIENNTVRDIYTPGYAHDPNHWFYLYTDEGSSGITIRGNHCPTDKFLKNSCGPGNVWENNVDE